MKNYDHWQIDHVRNFSILLFALALRIITPFEIRWKLAKSLIVPLFQYCDVLYSSCNAMLLKKVNVAFNSVIRYVQGLTKYDHITQYNKTLLNCTFFNFMKYRHCCLVFKIWQNGPPYLADLFRRGQSVRTNNFITLFNRSNIMMNSFASRGIKLWNNLPLDIKHTNSFHRFKKMSFLHFSIID